MRDAVIVGGGLAGSATAILLACAGRDVVLIEKEDAPRHKVCGEFLSAEALGILATLGIDIAALGAVPIQSVLLVGKSHATETKLPFAAMSLTRRALDEALLDAAARAGATVLRGHAATSLERCGEGWQAMVSDENIVARQALLATGKHDLRGWPRPAGTQSNLLGFKMYWRLAPAQAAALEGRIALLLYRGGYAGLQLVEDGSANLGCLIERSAFQKMGGRWSDLLRTMQQDCSLLRQLLAGAEPLLERPLAVSPIPYGFVREHSSGVWAVGDQAAVIPSFTGDGMSIALYSGSLAAEMLLAGASPEAFQQRLHGDLRRQVGFATHLSQALIAQPQRAILEAAVRVWPGAMRHVAARTRISFMNLSS